MIGTIAATITLGTAAIAIIDKLKDDNPEIEKVKGEIIDDIEKARKHRVKDGLSKAEVLDVEVVYDRIHKNYKTVAKAAKL